MNGISRRQFLRMSALALPAALGVDAHFVEPTHLRVSTPRLPVSGPRRFVHFSDFHFKGDRDYAGKVISAINAQQPEFVCFTGDLVEDARFLDEALDFLSQIKAPLYGSPGNHDYWSRSPFPKYQRVFEKSGGRWLVDSNVYLPDKDLEFVGMGLGGVQMLKAPQSGKRILLSHYPKAVDDLGTRRFDLILSGHSHGGQIRLPGYGALAVPWGVGPYELGHYQTKSGSLYVNAGIGTYRIPWRFNCRPEITVLSI